MPRSSLEVCPIHIIPCLNWFGEHGAVTGQPSFAEYRARTPSSALVFSRTGLLAIAGEHACYRDAMMELLSLTIRTCLELAGDLTGLKVEDRVRSKLFTLSGHAEHAAEGFVVPVSQDELALVSCASRATVSKVLTKLEEAAVLKVGYRKITVFDRKALIETLWG